MTDATVEELFVNVPYSIKFTNNKPIPIDTFVQSLLAYERLIKRTEPFIERAFPGIDVIRIEVDISKIEAGSLFEDLLVKIVFKSQENYENAKDVVATMFESNKALTTAVCIGVAAYVGFGVMHALDKGAPSTHIAAYNSVVAQQGSTINIPEKALQEITQGVRDKKRLSKDAISAIAPARLEKGVSIESSCEPTLTVPSGFISEAPTVYPDEEPRQDRQVMTRTRIEIWASDRESYTKTWAGSVPGIVEKRVKFTLDESVDPNQLHGNRSIVADIIIEKQFDSVKKEFIPKKIDIIKVYPYGTDVESSQ